MDHNNIYIVGVSEGEEKEQGIKKKTYVKKYGWKFSETGEGKRHTSLESTDSSKQD